MRANGHRAIKRWKRKLLRQYAFKYWAGTEQLQFETLRRPAKRVFGNQASGAQIECDFGGATVAQSEALYKYIVCQDVAVPPPQLRNNTKSSAIKDFLSTPFTGKDAELEEAKN